MLDNFNRGLENFPFALLGPGGTRHSGNPHSNFLLRGVWPNAPLRAGVGRREKHGLALDSLSLIFIFFDRWLI